MTSSVAINHNNSHDSRVFHQLLFLEKLRHNEIDCDMASSFVNSSEFNSILKEFKRKRQQEGDQKKWETFLEKRQQEEVNKTISEIKATYPTNEYQEVGNNYFSCGSLESVSNVDNSKSGTEYTNHWLENNHLFLGHTFHNSEENNNKHFISPDLNESSLSLKNDCQIEALTFTRDDSNVKNYPCKQNTTKKMQYQYSNFQNEEIVNDFLNVIEQNNFHFNEMNSVLNLPEPKKSHTGKIKRNHRKGKSVLLLEKNPIELQSDETNAKVNELKEMMPNPILISKKSKILLMIQKLAAVHHGAIQALQVIEKQLQTISIFGKTQELLCSFYNCIYELTLILKPFYGYLKTQVLDEVEKHLIETIKLLSELKSEEKFSLPRRGIKDKINQLKSSIEPPPWMKKSAALARLKFGPPIRIRKRKSHQEQKSKVLERKQSKDSIKSEQGKKLDQEQDMIKPINFMMSVKQRPGAELRRANFNPIKTEEPKTMIEIISREGTIVEDISREFQNNKVLPDLDPKLCCTETTLPYENKLEKISETPIVEKTVPKNVKLVYIKCEDDDQRENIEPGINVLEGDNLSPANECNILCDELVKYRRAFKKYKKNIPLYEKNTLNTVVSMSETFLEETITEVSKEINKMKISDLLGMVDEFETCEPDLDSSM
ncbi:unnamed protein product [Nezara viridula]|uniref:Uncharacterized protein n=1 Tax=Nezara viridula TaxID=85310 RepID=A0A9P0HDH6_NEZVI|nr:unnamed protein product [Nezara viridula]